MSRTVVLLFVLVASAARADVNDLNLIMTAEPSVDQVAAAQGLYLPGETVHFTVSLAMTDAPAPDVAVVHVNYWGSTALVDIESDALVPAFPLTFVFNFGADFGAETLEVPSPLTIPQAPSAIDFFTFNAFAPASLGQSGLVNILGAPEIEQVAFAATSGLTVLWRNHDQDHDHDIVGGMLTVTSVPEPGTLVIVALLTGILYRRRKRLGSHYLADRLVLLPVVVVLNAPVAVRARAIVESNPPQSNPWCDACPVFRDVLQPGTGTEVTREIGGAPRRLARLHGKRAAL